MLTLAATTPPDSATDVAAAEHRHAEIGRGEPEISLGFDACHLRSRPRPRGFEERKGVDLHGVVLQLDLRRDGLVQRQHLAFVFPRDGIGGAIGAIGLARFRRRVHAQLPEPVCGFEIALLGLAHIGLAEIEQRYFEHETIAAAIGALLAAILLRLGDAAGVEHVEEMCLACEPIGSRHRLHLCPRHLHIDPGVHRVLLDRPYAPRRARQTRQRARQIGIEIGLPQAHQPREPFACRRRLLLGADKLCVHLGGEYPTARLVEPVHRAGAFELVRELSRGRGASLGVAESGNDLPCRNRAHISSPRLRRHPQGLLRGAELGRRELIRRDPGARRHGKQRQ